MSQLDEKGFSTAKPSKWRSIKRLLMKRKVVDIHIHLFIFHLDLSFPSEHDWFHFYLSFFQFISIIATMAYGCGWSIGFYRSKGELGHLSIHLKRWIIGFHIGFSGTYFITLKTAWIISRLSDSSKRKMKETFNEILIESNQNKS